MRLRSTTRSTATSCGSATLGKESSTTWTRAPTSTSTAPTLPIRTSSACSPRIRASGSAGWEHGLLIKSDRNGWRLLDYGDLPFTGPTGYFSHPGPGYCDGLAWDGQDLWALDAHNRRIGLIEKTESGKVVTADLAAKHATEGEK